ncbi:MAG: discoidin domain-containing protein, partial [Specibacter sp.]
TVTALSDGTFGVLYEGDGNTITFGKFNADWLDVQCGTPLVASLAAAPVSGANGATVQAQLTVTNTGTTALDGATASFQAKAGWTLGSVVVPSIAAGTSAVVSVPVTIPAYAKAGSVNLTATLTLGPQAVNQTVPVTITGGAATDIVGLKITGSATDTTRDLAANPYAVGDAVPYQFVVDSLSNVTAAAVPTSGNFSPFVPAGAGNCRYSALAVWASYTCGTPRHAVTADDLANGYFVPSTTWDVTGGTAAKQSYTITGDEVDLLVRKPSLSATYTGAKLVDVDSSGFASVGDTISYTAVVTNNGNVRLTGVTVAGQDPFDLAVNESKTFTSVYTLTAADVAANKVVRGLVVTAKNGTKPAGVSVSADPVAACSDKLCGQAPPMDNLIPQDQISINSVSSEELTGEPAPSGPAAALLDGNVNSYWHTKWTSGNDTFPHSVVFDLGKSYSVTGFEYTQRQTGSNGKIKDYEIYVSDSAANFGTKVSSGSFADVKTPQRIAITGNKPGRYVKLVGLNSIAGNAFGGGAEVNIGGLPVVAGAATVSASPGTVEAGKDISITVGGFPAGTSVALSLDGGISLGSAT